MSVIEQTLPTGTWTIDPVHSTASFAVRHSVVATFRGGFREVDATLRTVEGEPVLIGVVPVDSVDVRDENLGGHLLSPDFFDAERHPHITFVSKSIRAEDGGTIAVDGDLTVKGITRPVTARGTIAGPGAGLDGNERVGIALSTKVDRTAFGLNWNAPLPTGALALGNDVTITVELELVRAED